MIKLQRESPHAPFSLGLKYKVILFPIGVFYRLWVSTIRFKFVDANTKMMVLKNDKPVIITLWHNRLFLAGECKFCGEGDCERETGWFVLGFWWADCFELWS